MTILIQWQQHFEHMRQNLPADFPCLQPLVAYHWQAHAPVFFQDCSLLAQALAEWGKVSGWLQETSRVVTLDHAVMELRDRPLAAEWVQGEQHGRLFYDPEQGWGVVRDELRPVDPQQANALARVVEHLQVQTHRPMQYLEIWQPDETQSAPMCKAAFFKAFKEE